MTEPVTIIGEQLLMSSGSVSDLVETNPWPALAKQLQDIYLPIQRRQHIDDQAGYVVPLCTVYYAHGQQRVIHTGEDDILLGKRALDELIDFLEEFMTKNGQWAYIKQQQWYTRDRHVIAIDVNYYPDRSGFTTFIAFHKDTAGNNIFVNLIFDNDSAIEATEWFVDTGEPSKQRKAWQAQWLPDAHLKVLDATRSALRVARAGKEVQVTGGVSKYLYTYVSWLDDLIWHSTPNGNRRTEYSADAAARAYDSFAATVNVQNGFYYEDTTLDVVVLGWEVLGTMAESQDTQLYQWLKQAGLQMQDLTRDRSKLAWRALYRNSNGQTDGRDRFVEDAKIRALQPWRITGSHSEVNAEDQNMPGSKSIDEPPALLSRLRRTNSFSDVQEELAKVRKANEGKPRAFVRTWVRILKSDDAELARNEIQFQQLT